MAENHIYLTVSKEKRQPENDGYISVISIGSPQRGDEDVKVLDVSVQPNMKSADVWFKKMKREQPWVKRN